jgi:aryl-alcohol dehydrogenase-like predicted oxidoreductase
MKVQKRRLGAGGPAVSAIGVGAMSFAGFYGKTTEEAAHALLAAALDLGIDHIDTSNVYGAGLSERMIGSFLARQGKARDGRFRIATKAAIRRDPENGRRFFDNSPEHLAAELEGSLMRLGLEAVDLFYVHRRDPEVPIEEVAGTLAGLVRAGKTRAIGFSEIAPSSLRRAAAVHPVAAVQSEYSLGTRAPDLGLVQTCAALGTALVAFSPVGRALLTDAPPTPERVAASEFLSGNPRFVEPNRSANLALTDGFRALAAEMGTSAAALAIAWLLSRSPKVIPIPGTRSVAHLRELAAGTELSLSEDDIERIETVLPVGWAHGDRYSPVQWVGPERYS